MGKKYQTRDGHPVRLLCTDRDERNSGSCHFPVVGLVEHGGERELFCWTIEGSRRGYACEDDFDLIPVPTKHEGWMLVIWSVSENCWLNGRVYNSLAEASTYVDKDRRLAHVTWES